MFTKKDNDGSGTYVIGYWDTGVGVLFYDYVYIPSGDELAIAAAPNPNNEKMERHHIAVAD